MRTVINSVTDKRVIAADHFVKLGAELDAATKPVAGYVKGLVLGKITLTGKFGPYDDAALDGRDVAVGVLAHPVDLDTDSTGAELDTPGAIYVHAAVYEADLTGLDANGKADLAAHFIFV